MKYPRHEGRFKPIWVVGAFFKVHDMKKEIEAVLNEFNSLGIDKQLDYGKFYLYSIITHSTAIEGSTVTEIENQLLFDEGLSSSKPLIEQLMNLDLKRAYEKCFEYAEKHEDITIELLCGLSSIVMQNTGSTYRTIAGDFSSSKGELRLLNVSAGRGGRSYLAWQKIQDRLQAFCDWINEERRRIQLSKTIDIWEVYELSFEAHYRLVCIHPWADGNGRMSRLVMNMIQYEAGVIPSIVKKEKRLEYIQSLEESEGKETSRTFIDFMFSHHIENLKQQIGQYKASLEIPNTEGGQINNKGGQKRWSETTLKVLNLIESNPRISRKELSEKLNINPSAVQKHIDKLKSQRIIERSGGMKGGMWIVRL